VAVNLKCNRWLTAEQSPPPTAQQPLVQGVEHVHDRLCGRIVAAIRDDPETYVPPPPPSAQTS
jgi:hypothetical protein